MAKLRPELAEKTATNPARNARRSDPLAALRAQAEERLRGCLRLMEAGVCIVDPATTYVEPGVTVGEGTVMCWSSPTWLRSMIAEECQVL